MCTHQPPCPRWAASDRRAARIVSDQVGQGWSLLCNGVIVFDDGGELLPDHEAVGAARPTQFRECAIAVQGPANSLPPS
jgi:hypothetical protein